MFRARHSLADAGVAASAGACATIPLPAPGEITAVADGNPNEYSRDSGDFPHPVGENRRDLVRPGLQWPFVASLQKISRSGLSVDGHRTDTGAGARIPLLMTGEMLR